MNRVVMACVGVLALVGGSAGAAELPPYYQPGPAYNPIYTWTGFYLGNTACSPTDADTPRRFLVGVA